MSLVEKASASGGLWVRTQFLSAVYIRKNPQGFFGTNVSFLPRYSFALYSYFCILGFWDFLLFGKKAY